MCTAWGVWAVAFAHRGTAPIWNNSITPGSSLVPFPSLSPPHTLRDTA